jgi:hypothetical protein
MDTESGHRNEPVRPASTGMTREDRTTYIAVGAAILIMTALLLFILF